MRVDGLDPSQRHLLCNVSDALRQDLERRRAEARARPIHDEAVRMHGGGAPFAAMAGALGTVPRTLARWLAAGHAPLRNRKPAGRAKSRSPTCWLR